MCGTCGCSENEHEHEHPDSGQIIPLEQQVLAKNDARAQRNHGWLEDNGILTLNLMSSPGSGKTTLLERTMRELHVLVPMSVIEGDQETQVDTDRLRETGCPVVQINTGAGCHLDADMVASALRTLQPPRWSVVFVENVGNLVCPALFFLGEQYRVVVASVTEGVDKPLKYPHMFRAGDVVLLNKTDLLPHVGFDVEQFKHNARHVNDQLQVIEVSALTGDGMPTWYRWLRERIPGVGARAKPLSSQTSPI